MDLRGWQFEEDYYTWVASNGATPLYGYPEHPEHSLVVTIGLYVAGDNTWNLVYGTAKTVTGPIPPSEQMFIENIKDYLP